MAAPPAQSAVALDTTGSPYKVVLKLATPTVFAMLTQSIVNEVDIVFFSWLPCPESSNAQAALLPSLILLWLFGGSLSAISVGTQALAARRFAQQKHADAGSVLVNSWFFALTAGIVFTVGGYLSLPYVLKALIKVPEVREAATAYLNWRLLGIVSMAMTFSFKSFFDGIGKTHVHMVSAIVMNAMNIVLCLIFIFGRLGAPRMGIAGAGLAGFVSTWLGLAIMVGWAAFAKYRKVFRPFSLNKLEKPLTRDILKLSIPSAVATVAVMSGFALFAMIVSKLDALSGTASVVNPSCPGGKAEAVNSAATTVIVGILKLTFTACLAFGTSTATLVSQSLGEGNPAKAERFGWVSVRLGLVLFGVVGLLEGVIFPNQILSFVSHSPPVIEAAILPMRVMGICTPAIAVGMILTQALFGAGNTRFVMIVELILHFMCLVPLAWLLGITLGFGLIGIWSAAVTYVVLLTAVMVWKFKSGDWKAIKI
ncbi:MAG: MATE family efflux transporter [Polyangiaceae bacterium]|nr:MATE family efflux transporter [Polyangiaceae bacterium]